MISIFRNDSLRDPYLKFIFANGPLKRPHVKMSIFSLTKIPQLSTFFSSFLSLFPLSTSIFFHLLYSPNIIFTPSLLSPLLLKWVEPQPTRRRARRRRRYREARVSKLLIKKIRRPIYRRLQLLVLLKWAKPFDAIYSKLGLVDAIN